jgi:hypothetical protein
MAAVFIVLPLPTAPKLVTLNVALGITGNGMLCARTPKAHARTKPATIAVTQVLERLVKEFILQG